MSSIGELEIQKEQQSTEKAASFYRRQMKSSLNEKMKTLIKNQEMFFMATSDAQGNCDCSPRFGQKGFVHILNDETLTFPDYKGNGVFASLGNILENPHIGLVFVDFFQSTVGLHVNGKAHSYSPDNVPNQFKATINKLSQSIHVPIERWIIINIDEAYIHCSKHVPKLVKADKKIKWGTDDVKEKATDFFE